MFCSLGFTARTMTQAAHPRSCVPNRPAPLAPVSIPPHMIWDRQENNYETMYESSRPTPPVSVISTFSGLP